MVVNLKTSMDGSVRRQKTNRYLSKFHRLHPRPHYSFLGKLKDAVLLKESALIEFLYRFFQHKIYYYFKQHRCNCDERQFENFPASSCLLRSRSLSRHATLLPTNNLVPRACVTLIQRTGNGRRPSGIIQNRNHQIMVPVELRLRIFS